MCCCHNRSWAERMRAYNCVCVWQLWRPAFVSGARRSGNYWLYQPFLWCALYRNPPVMCRIKESMETVRLTLLTAVENYLFTITPDCWCSLQPVGPLLAPGTRSLVPILLLICHPRWRPGRSDHCCHWGCVIFDYLGGTVNKITGKSPKLERLLDARKWHHGDLRD